MKFLINFLLFFCMTTNAAFAQQEIDENIQAEEEEQIFQVMFDFSLVRGFTAGEGFLNDAYNLKMGVETGINLTILNRFIVGGRYDIIGASLIKPDMVGNFKNTKIHNIMANVGYRHTFSPLLDVSGMVGYGWASYANRVRSKVVFYDHAQVFSLQLIFGYSINESFGLYFSAKARHDNMKIKVSPEIQKYFDDNDILSFGLGVRFKSNQF